MGSGHDHGLSEIRHEKPLWWALGLTPLFSGTASDLHHNIVHAVQGGDVDLTMVAGRVVVEGGKLRTADLRQLIDDANLAVPDLFGRRVRLAFKTSTGQRTGQTQRRFSPTAPL